MKANPTAENIFGTLGAVCWSIQLIPQIILNRRRHNATGLQPAMMLLWSCAGVPLGIYNVSRNLNIALRVQPQILSILSLITLAQCLYYENKWPIRKCLLRMLSLAALLGGIEAGGILGLQAPIRNGIAWPAILMASLSAAFLAAGVLRHYWDIYVFRTVRGISFVFVALDAAGDLFSLISLFFMPKFDALAAAIYGTELTLWIGIFLLGFCFNFRAWIRRRRRPVSRHDGIELPPMERRHSAPSLSVSSSVSVFTTSGVSVLGGRRVGVGEA